MNLQDHPLDAIFAIIERTVYNQTIAQERGYEANPYAWHLLNECRDEIRRRVNKKV